MHVLAGPLESEHRVTNTRQVLPDMSWVYRLLYPSLSTSSTHAPPTINTNTVAYATPPIQTIYCNTLNILSCSPTTLPIHEDTSLHIAAPPHSYPTDRRNPGQHGRRGRAQRSADHLYCQVLL